MKVEIDRGFKRTTRVIVDAVLITPEIIQYDCIECGGTGDWTPFLPEDIGFPVQCVECKGTGRTYAS